MLVRRGRPAAFIVVFVVALLVCAAAYAENYTYKRTKAGDADVASMILRKTDFPAQFRLTGGRGAPDETPNTDSCNGYTPKERDLVVVGDAASTFHNANRSDVYFAPSASVTFQNILPCTCDLKARYQHRNNDSDDSFATYDADQWSLSLIARF